MLIVKQYTLLTMKPLIYVANLGEEDLEDPMQNTILCSKFSTCKLICIDPPKNYYLFCNFTNIHLL